MQKLLSICRWSLYKTLYFISWILGDLSQLAECLAFKVEKKEMYYRRGRDLVKIYHHGGPDARQKLKDLS